MLADKTQREYWIDFAKFFAIFIVASFHSEQFFLRGKLGDDVLSFPLNNVCNSFAMPLFILLSGLFFYKVESLSFLPFLKKKIIQLILPTFSWGGLQFITNSIIHKSFIPYDLVTDCYKIWFLITLFECFLLTYIFIRIFKNKFFAFLICTFFLISIRTIDYTSYLITFFWLGIFIRKYYSLFLSRIKSIWLISGLIYFLSYIFWWDSHMLYNPLPFYNMAYINSNGCVAINLQNIIRCLKCIIVGGSGSIFMISTIYIIYSPKLIRFAKIGSLTLGIYLMHTYILSHLISNAKNIKISGIDTFLLSYLFSPISGLLIMLVCYYVLNKLKRSSLFAFLFLGLSKKSK